MRGNGLLADVVRVFRFELLKPFIILLNITLDKVEERGTLNQWTDCLFDLHLGFISLTLINLLVMSILSSAYIVYQSQMYLL